MKTKSKISPRLVGRPNVSEYGDTVKTLAAVAEKLSPDGKLVVVLMEQSEAYLTEGKVLTDIVDMESIYSRRALQMDPELGVEYAEIIGLLKTASNIIKKRRDRVYKRKKANYEKRVASQKAKESVVKAKEVDSEAGAE